ncbi:MAG: tetratricopeptide repeat protein [Acidobacteriota bacterium]
MRARNRESVVAYLRAISRRRPRMIALEDLHHADELTRDVVSALGPAAAGAPLFVLLCHRPGFEPPPGAVRLPLAEIPERDLQALLVASLHGREIGREVVERVLARAEGNPFYVEEMARHLLETDRSPASDDLPGTITALLQARLDTLSPAARSAAQLASVLGRSFPKELLVHLLGRRSRSDAILEELASRQLVLPATSGDELIFRHALTRDVAYGSVLLRRRASLHRRVARAVEDRYGAEPAAYLPMMAHHWEHAGDVVRARARYLDAGEAALARYAHGEAERLLRAHIALAPRPDKASIHARHQLGARVLRFLGRIEEALAEHERGLADARLAGDGPGEINHITATANVFLVQGRKREARALHEQALRMADAGGHRVNRAVCIANLAAIAKDLGDVVEAERLGWEAIAVQRELGDAHQLAIALNNLATLFDEQGRRDESLALAEESLAIFERAGERRLAGIVGANLAGVYLELGDGNRARAAFETSRRIAAEIGDVIAEGSALSGLASVEESCGNRSLAIARSRMALACAVRSGDVRLHAWVLSSLGAQEVDGDELEMAARHFEEAERLIERLSDPSLLARLRVFQGRLVLAQGRDPAPLLEEARRLAGEIGARPGSQIQDAIERLDAAARERSA